VEQDADDTKPIEVTDNEDGTRTLKYKYRRVREDASGNLLSQYIYTTAGRVIYNMAIQEALAS
ncbi:MAG: hypothetical protein AAFX46_22765, partial [Cyanobacteria bacterium J06636_27]